MVGNNETLEEVRLLLMRRELTGKVILNCRRGLIEEFDVTEKHRPAWKERLHDAKKDSKG